MPTKRFNLVFILVAITLAILLTMRVINSISFRTKQRNLAERLGVNLQDYPPTSAFPQTYFFSVLRPGMTKSEVHEIVAEYEQVFTCNSLDELYYYYSKDETDTMRIMIFYDFDGKFHKLMGEDDSSKLYDEGCVPGLLN